MKFWLTLTLSLMFFAGCTPYSPADPNIKNVRARVLSGEAVTFTKPGYSLCGKSVWTEMRLGDFPERDRIVLKKQLSVLNPGHSTCYSIGDVVPLNVSNRQLNGGGLVRINSLTLVLADRLRPNLLKGGFFASSNNFDQYVNAIKLRIKPDQENMITIVDLTYLDGSAIDESALREKDSQDSQGDGYVETTQDGQYLPGSQCKSPYTYIAIPSELQSDFTSGRLESWYTLADFSCLPQGAVVDLSTGKGIPPTARVKISKIKMFRVRALDPKFFSMSSDYDFQAIRDRVTHDNTRNSEWMVVVDFKVVTP